MTNTVIGSENKVFVQITEESTGTVTVESDKMMASLQVATAGPQGPAGLGVPVVMNSPTSGSVVYYDTEVASFRADDSHTFLTTTDGGSF